MKSEIKREIEKIELPGELHERTKLGIKQVRQAKKGRKKYPKWMVGTVASLIIMGTAYSISGSQIADAAETLLGKLFGAEEQVLIEEDIKKSAPDYEGGALEAKMAFSQMEQHLTLAKEHLSPEEFTKYSQLIKEDMELSVKRMGDPDNKQFEQRAAELAKEIGKYGIYELTVHTLAEAQEMVSYPINYPTYLPKDYVLIEEEARTEEINPGQDPVVLLQYAEKNGDYNFYTFTQKINHTDGEELTFYDEVDTYQRDGYAFEHAYDNGEYHSNVQAMRISLPEEGYEIIMVASLLTKEEMENILLSMVEK